MVSILENAVERSGVYMSLVASIGDKGHGILLKACMYMGHPIQASGFGVRAAVSSIT